MRIVPQGRFAALCASALLMIAATANAQYLVRSYDEAERESNISKPRLSIQNMGTASLTGFQMRYRFLADPGKTPVVESWYLAGGNATLKSVGGGLWDLVLSFPNQALQPGQVFPDASGLAVGLHYADWSAWDKSDDPSHQAAATLQLNGKVVVEDASGNLLAGSFPANGVAGRPHIIVAAREEATTERNISRIRLIARNVGDGATDSLRLQYYFATEGKKLPKLDVYDAAGAKLSLHKISGRNWRVDIDYSGRRIEVGKRTSETGVLFALHYDDWSNWDKTNDHSNPGGSKYEISRTVVGETENVNISGNAPTRAEIIANSDVTAAPAQAAMVAAADNASYLLKPDGTVWGWGYANQYSRFGTASRHAARYSGTIQEYPVQISELKDVRQIAASGDHMLALDGNGMVWAVGTTNKSGALAARAGADELATNTCDHACLIGGLAEIISISTGGWGRNLVMDKNGSVFQWGWPVNRNEDWIGPPQQIVSETGSGFLTGMAEIRACEGVSMARTTSGAVYAWNMASDKPIQVASSGIVQLACDDPSYGGMLLKADGSLLRLAGPFRESPYSIAAVPGMPAFASIRNNSSGWIGTAKDDGRVLVWNSQDWVGLPAAPTAQSGFAGATSFDVAGSHAIALLADGTVWAVGLGEYGAFGNGLRANSTVPVKAAIDASSDVLNAVVEPGNYEQELVYENNSNAGKTVTFNLSGTPGRKVRLVYSNMSETSELQLSGSATGVPSRKLVLPPPPRHSVGVLVNDAAPLASTSASVSSTAAPAAAATYQVGASRTWNMFKTIWTEKEDGTREGAMTSDPNEQVVGICRKVVAKGDRIFYFWVPDAQWGSDNGMLDQAKVDALSAVIVENETSVYQSIRSIAGEEWGLHSDNSKISETVKDFHVVLTDLDGDGNPVGGRSDVLGYFFSGDPWLKSEYSYSNEALVIYMDSRWLGYSKGVWSATGDYQRDVYSTAAHELQHMVYNYQKSVKNALPSSETWPNEMLSMMTEEVLAKELGWTSSQPAWTRFPYWMMNPNKSFTVWSSMTTDSYEAAYAFGAMVFRNGHPRCETPAGSNACDGRTANGFHGIYRSSQDGFGALEDAFFYPGQRGYREWFRMTGVTLAASGATAPDGAGYPAWSLAGRDMDPIHPWSDFTITPTIYTSLPTAIEPFASVPVESDLPSNGQLTITVPANTWVTLLPNF